MSAFLSEKLTTFRDNNMWGAKKTSQLIDDTKDNYYIYYKASGYTALFTGKFNTED